MRAAPNGDEQLHLVVELGRHFGGQANGGAVTGERVIVLVEEDRHRRYLLTRLLGVLTIVQSDAHDLAGFGEKSAMRDPRLVDP